MEAAVPRRKLLWFAAWLSGVTIAGAQDARPPVELPPVVVRADRLPVDLPAYPGAVTVVDAASDLEGRPRLTLNEALNRVPGVSVQSAQNFAQDTRVSIRGFGARSAFGIRGVRLFLEHLPLTLPDGQSTLDAVDMSLVDRVEVIRGASSAQYGNASGGVVRLGLGPLPEEPFFETGYLGGSFGLQRWQGTAGTAWEGGAAEAVWTDFRTDGYRQNSAAEQRFLTARVEHALSDDVRLRLLVAHADAPWAGDAGGLTAAEAMANRRQAAPSSLLFHTGESLRETAAAIELDIDLAPETSLVLTGFGAAREFENRLPFRAGGVAAFDRAFAGGSIMLRHEPEDGVGFAAGLETAWQRDDRTRRNNDFGTAGALTLDQRETVTQTGAFAEARLPLTDDLTISAGVRGDRIVFEAADRFLADGDDSGRITFWESAWSAGLSQRLGSGMSVFTHFAQAYETPTTTELADPTGGGGFNPALEPQRSLTWEAGLRGSTPDGDLSGELALFWIRTENELVPFELPAFPGRRFFRSAGETERRGIEASAQWNPGGHWQIGGMLSWGHFEYRSFQDLTGQSLAGNRLPGVPQWEAFTEIGWRPPEGFYAVLEMDHTGAMRADDANAVSVPDFTRVNARAGWRGKIAGRNLHAYIGCDNALGAEGQDNVRINAAAGRYFEPAPEQSFYVGISLRL